MNLVELTRLLKLRGGYELVNHNATPTQIRMLGRVPKEMMGSWLLVAHRLLSVSEGAAWSVDISKQYFLRSNRILFAWRIILQGEDLDAQMIALCEAISNAPRPKTIVEEQRLYGASPDRNMPRGGKGAQGVLTAVVGPMAIAQQRAGGG